MRVIVRTSWLPKAGNTAEEYEDAFFSLRQGECAGAQFRFAVADGASEGMLSGQWAGILVKSYGRLESAARHMDELLGRAHQAWAGWLAHYLEHRQKQGRPIQWFEEPGLQKGAFSTLLGLSLSGGEASGTWESLALGDSCLFQVRGKRLLAAFPLDWSSQFDSRPFLIASHPAHNERLMEHVRRQRGLWRRGDRFFLATDALAQWFLTVVESGGAPWAMLPGAAGMESRSLEAWASALRSGKLVRNDDITLIEIEVV